MGLRYIPYVELVAAELGLVASGVTTNAGTWNLNVDVFAYLISKGITIPENVKGLSIVITNTNTSAQWGGVRVSGKTTSHYLFDIPSLTREQQQIPYDDTSRLDFYLEHTGHIKFRIIGFWDDEAVFFDIDQPLPFIAVQANGTWANRTITEATPGATLMLGNAAPSIRPVGNLSEPLTTAKWSLLKLPENNTIDYKSFGSTPLIGYIRSSVNDLGYRAVQQSFVRDSVWRTFPTAYPGKAFVLITTDKTSSADQIGFRPKTGYGTWDGGPRTNGRFEIVPLDVNGEFEYRCLSNATTVTQFWVDGTIDDYSAGQATITGPATLRPGENIAVTTSSMGGAIISATIVDALSNEIPIYASSNTIRIPTPKTGPYVLYGPVTIVVESATKSASFTAEFIPAIGHAVTIMEEQYVGEENIMTDWPTPLPVDGQIYYSSANTTEVFSDGRYATDATTSWKGIAIFLDGFAEEFQMGITRNGLMTQTKSPIFDGRNLAALRPTNSIITFDTGDYGNAPPVQVWRRHREGQHLQPIILTPPDSELGIWEVNIAAPQNHPVYIACPDGYNACATRNPEAQENGYLLARFASSKQFRAETTDSVLNGHTFPAMGTLYTAPGRSAWKHWWVQYQLGANNDNTQTDICCPTYISTLVSVAGNASQPNNGTALVAFNDYWSWTGWNSSGVFLANHPTDPVGGLGQSHYRFTSNKTGPTKTMPSKIVSGPTLIHGTDHSVIEAATNFGLAYFNAYLLVEDGMNDAGANPRTYRTCVVSRNQYLAAGDTDCFQCAYVTSHSTLETSSFVTAIKAESWTNSEIRLKPDDWERQMGNYVIILKPDGSQEAKPIPGKA